MVKNKRTETNIALSDLKDIKTNQSTYDKFFGLSSVSARINKKEAVPRVVASTDGTQGIGSGLDAHVTRIDFAGIIGDVVNFPGLKIDDAKTLCRFLQDK